jgi:hypothetical protein
MRLQAAIFLNCMRDFVVLFRLVQLLAMHCHWHSLEPRSRRLYAMLHGRRAMRGRYAHTGLHLRPLQCSQSAMLNSSP